MAAKPETKAGDDAAGGKKKKGKGLLIGLIATVVLAGGGGAGWYFTRPVPHADEDGDLPVASSKKAVETIFMALDTFTLNLADPGGERLIQLGISLELASPEVQAQVTKHLPVIRNSLLLLISSQESKALLTLEGKLALADEIAVRTGMALGWKPEEPEPVVQQDKASARMVATRRNTVRQLPRPNPVVGVHFAQFLVQ